MLTAGEATLQWVEEKRHEAEVVEQYAPDQATTIRKLADDLERRVLPLLPRWVCLSRLHRTKGLSIQTLRHRAQELAARTPPLARKDAAGHWEIHRDAAAGIPVRNRYDPITETDDLDELA